MSRLLKSAFVLLLAILGGAYLLIQDARRVLEMPLRLEQPQSHEIVSGTPLNAVTAALQARGIVEHPRLGIYLSLYARITGLASELKAGEYELTPGMSGLDALRLFTSGKVLLHELKLIEGWTAEQALQAIAADPNLRHTLDLGAGADWMAAIDQKGQHPEGQLFPDTYRFPKGTTDVAFLRRAHAAMQTVLQSEWERRASDLPYDTPAQALIMASIVEKETGVAAERPTIAGVFVNRLRIGMRLQTDPTVIYGMGRRYDGNIRRADLTSDTPYNTYTRHGLPPTPICLPGRAAIHAALHPAQTRALYFVARGDGSHTFSETLQAHNAAVRQFLMQSRKTSNDRKN